MVCPLGIGHFTRGVGLYTQSRPIPVRQCVGNHKPPEATVMGKKETLHHDRHTTIKTLNIFDPTLFQRAKVLCGR